MIRLMTRVSAIVFAVGMLMAGTGSAGAAGAPAGPSGPTLQAVRAHGQVRCGVATGLTGFSERDAAGAWTGFNVDYCRALAAAVLGDPTRVSFLPFGVQPGMAALARGRSISLTAT